jgi:nucleoside-diphosphate kinase
MAERTLILIKPDAFDRGLTGDVLARFEHKGLRITDLKLMRASEDIAHVHYAEHSEKPFFGELVTFITSAPTWALVVEGEGAIATMRKTIGATIPADADPSEKPFFGELVEFITRGPLVAAVFEGHEAVAAARQVIGATNPIDAAMGSIRGDYGLEVTFNLVHGSDSDESAEREIGIWFG